MSVVNWPVLPEWVLAKYQTAATEACYSLGVPPHAMVTDGVYVRAHWEVVAAEMHRTAVMVELMVRFGVMPQ